MSRPAVWEPMLAPWVAWHVRFARDLASEGSPAFGWFHLGLATSTLAAGWAVLPLARWLSTLHPAFAVLEGQYLADLAAGRVAFLAAFEDVPAVDPGDA